MIAVTEKLAWYVARSSGIVSWATVTASILWGLTLSSRLVRKRGVPAWLLDLHRYLGTLSLVFVLVHIGGLVADNFVYFGPSELFVPGKSPWKTSAVAWGIVAFYFLAAIQISSWLMRHMKRRIWHAIHLSSIGLWITATVHTFLAGQDRHNTLLQWFVLGSTILVLQITLFRVISMRSAQKWALRPEAPTPRGSDRVSTG
jgi:DMSO/TMAO reductase YedYZ heme-binding membrane subunit